MTFVLISEKRGPLTIEVAPVEFALAVIAISLVIITAVYSSLQYRNLEVQHEQLSSSVLQLQDELSRSQAQVSQLSDSLVNSTREALVIGGADDYQTIGPGQYSREILVDNLEIESEGQNLLLRFKIINNSENQQLKSGYFALVAEHNSADRAKFASYPADLLKSDSQALDYQRGDTYAIRYFKTVEAKITLQDRPSSYDRLKIVVFDQSGTVLLYHSRNLALER